VYVWALFYFGNNPYGTGDEKDSWHKEGKTMAWNDYSEQTGVLFEDSLLGAINNGHSSEEDDRFHGTDCRFDGVRADVTIKPIEAKDNVVKVGEPIQLPCGTFVEFGIRTGNSSGAKFDEPVLVVSFEMPSRAYIPTITESFAKIYADVKDYTSDLYWGFIDAHESEYPSLA